MNSILNWSIWPQILTDSTNLGHSEPGNNEKMTWHQPDLLNWNFTTRNCLVSYPEHPICGEVLPICRGYNQLILSTADRALLILVLKRIARINLLKYKDKSKECSTLNLPDFSFSSFYIFLLFPLSFFFFSFYILFMNSLRPSLFPWLSFRQFLPVFLSFFLPHSFTFFLQIIKLYNTRFFFSLLFFCNKEQFPSFQWHSHF